jgi:hypothetical protein
LLLAGALTAGVGVATSAGWLTGVEGATGALAQPASSNRPLNRA